MELSLPLAKVLTAVSGYYAAVDLAWGDTYNGAFFHEWIDNGSPPQELSIERAEGHWHTVRCCVSGYSPLQLPDALAIALCLTCTPQSHHGVVPSMWQQAWFAVGSVYG